MGINTEIKKNAQSALECAKQLCDELMEEYTIKTLPIAGCISYIQGVLLLGYQKLYKLTGEKKYYDFVKSWVDYHVTENGELVAPDESVPWFTAGTLDYRQPIILLFDLYDATGDEKYKKVLTFIAETMLDFPTTSKGSFWHNTGLKNEVWLDGLYMISPLLTRYAARFDKPEYFDLVALQITNMYENMRNKDGLLIHGWCEDKTAKWAKGEKGLSSTIWSRACGWLVTAVADILEFFPKEHEKYEKIVEIQNEILASHCKYQDSDGLWHQVLDKPNNLDNPQESSSSCLFLYAAAKGMRSGYLKEDYTSVVAKGIDGILKHVVKKGEDGKLIVSKICAGLCIVTGEYEHYIKAQYADNDSHGTGLFVQMCAEVYAFLNDRDFE